MQPSVASQPDAEQRGALSHRLQHQLHEVKNRAKIKSKQLAGVLHDELKATGTGRDDGHVGDEPENQASEAAINELTQNPAFNAATTDEKPHIDVPGRLKRTLAALQTTGHTISHPKAAIKSRVTRSTAGTLANQGQYEPPKANAHLVEAQDDLNEAKACAEHSDNIDGAPPPSAGADIYKHERRVKELEDHRDAIRVAWITDRHVCRVKAVDITVPARPDDTFFEDLDDCGYARYDWGRWIAYAILYHSHRFSAQYIDDFECPPFDADNLRRHIERLIVVSAPFQEIFSSLRRIYRWDDPAHTAKWMVIYILFLKFLGIPSLLFGCGIYKTILNYYCPMTITAVRKGMDKSAERGGTALKVGDLIDQHGPKDWLEPLMDEFGPIIQLQIADLTNFLEVVDNFYHFRNPYATVASLFLLTTILTIAITTSADFSVKVFWFLAGMYFFVSFPISSRFPRYRLLVSPWKWTFWDVPTHAEWAVQYLQQHAQMTREVLMKDDQDGLWTHEVTSKERRLSRDNESASRGSFRSPMGLNDADSISNESFHSTMSSASENSHGVFSFRCTHLSRPGSLSVSTTGLCFTPFHHSTLHSSNAAFAKPYRSLREMSKEHASSSGLSSLVKSKLPPESLELIFLKEVHDDYAVWTQSSGKLHEELVEVIVLENVRDRDKAFNAILGFSRKRWQCLQKKCEN